MKAVTTLALLRVAASSQIVIANNSTMNRQARQVILRARWEEAGEKAFSSLGEDKGHKPGLRESGARTGTDTPRRAWECLPRSLIAYFLRRLRINSNPPPSNAIALMPEPGSISGTDAIAKADTPMPSNINVKSFVKSTSFNPELEPEQILQTSQEYLPRSLIAYFLRRLRIKSNPPPSNAIALMPEPGSISGTAGDAIARADTPMPSNTNVKNFVKSTSFISIPKDGTP
jgi:hypothetical protein